MKTDILNITSSELSEYILAAGEPEWRVEQILKWLSVGHDFSEMTNLSSKLRQKLSEDFFIAVPSIKKKLVSSIDGTVKYLFEYADGQSIESVVMKYKHGNTVCISTQAGCRMGCKFCASTAAGLSRNLTSSELLGQVLVSQRDSGERISNIVLMGIGEPLDNYENVIAFLKKVTSPESLCIGARHISLSTCGLADKIDRLAKENLQITLSVSLHSYSDEIRSSLMPVNKKYNIDTLLKSCCNYFRLTGRRISFEYTLISGINDKRTDAEALSALLKKYFGNKMPFHVNLIPVNEVKGNNFSAGHANAFAKMLAGFKINATVRRSLGPDINAACGQLRSGLNVLS